MRLWQGVFRNVLPQLREGGRCLFSPSPILFASFESFARRGLPGESGVVALILGHPASVHFCRLQLTPFRLLQPEGGAPAKNVYSKRFSSGVTVL